MNPVLQTRVLAMALELSKNIWKVAFSDGLKIRRVSVAAGPRGQLAAQIARAKERLGLPPETPVLCCYEAGREGFWVHRWLQTLGVENLVVDPASIEVNRKQRRAKTNRLDVEKLVGMLRRWLGGERTLWKLVRVPSAQQEDERRLHRERTRLKRERTGHINRIRGLLFLHGVVVNASVLRQPQAARDWTQAPLPPELQTELARERQRLELADEQLAAIERQMLAVLATPRSLAERQAAKLVQLRSLGPVSAWVLSKELFGWRKLRNRREVGAIVGCTGTPYDSGQSRREQGISKAGNVWVRGLLVELAWGWLRHQPQSALAQWYQQRFAGGGARLRRIGIVALARKLLIALWRYLEQDQLPEGALLKAV